MPINCGMNQQIMLYSNNRIVHSNKANFYAYKKMGDFQMSDDLLKSHARN